MFGNTNVCFAVSLQKGSQAAVEDLSSPPTACGKLREFFSQQKPERSALVNNRWRKIRGKSAFSYISSPLEKRPYLYLSLVN